MSLDEKQIRVHKGEQEPCVFWDERVVHVLYLKKMETPLCWIDYYLAHICQECAPVLEKFC